MRVLDTATQAALEAGSLAPRDFLWISPRDRATGALQPRGYWSDLGAVTVPVADPATGLAVTRAYKGAGLLIKIGAVPLVSGLTVQTVEIEINHIGADADDLFRTYDLQRAPVELHRGFIDPQTARLSATAVCRFSGWVDEAPLTTPAQGGEGVLALTCASRAQELTQISAAKRSDADQRRRSASDGFYRHGATVGSWKITWGQPVE